MAQPDSAETTSISMMMNALMQLHDAKIPLCQRDLEDLELAYLRMGQLLVRFISRQRAT